MTVEALLDSIRQLHQDVLGQLLIGCYVHGSLALGCFQCWVGFYALILALEWLPRWIRHRR